MGAALKTKNAIADAFAEALLTKNVDKIRVGDVSEAAGVTKQTFYRYFIDKYDVMEYCFDRMFAGPIEGIASRRPFADCVREILLIAQQNRTLMLNAFGTNDFNNLFRGMNNSIRHAMTERIVAQGIIDEAEIKFMADSYAKTLIGCVRRWLGVGMDLSVDTLTNYLISCLPAKLASFFK